MVSRRKKTSDWQLDKKLDKINLSDQAAEFLFEGLSISFIFCFSNDALHVQKVDRMIKECVVSLCYINLWLMLYAYMHDGVIYLQAYDTFDSDRSNC